MKRIIVNVEKPVIEINGQVFEILKSDADILCDGQEAVKRCVQLDMSDPEAVRGMACWMRERIDGILGAGATEKVLDGVPVSLNAAMKILNAVVEVRAQAYRAYIRAEYGW